MCKEKIDVLKSNVIDAYKKGSEEEKQLIQKLFGKEIIAEQLDIKERINTFEDVLEYHCISKCDWENSIKCLEEDEIAYKQLKLITSAYNEGAVLKWGRYTPPKYYPRFYLGDNFHLYYCATWFSRADASPRLCFTKEENLIDSVNKFLPIYEKHYNNGE